MSISNILSEAGATLTVDRIEMTSFLAEFAGMRSVAMNDCSDQYREQVLDELTANHAEIIREMSDNMYTLDVLSEHYQHVFNIYAASWCKDRKVI